MEAALEQQERIGEEIIGAEKVAPHADRPAGRSDSRPRLRCTMRVDCGQLDPGTVIRPVPGGWHCACPSVSTRRSLRTGAPAAMRVYRLAALTVGAGIVAADE
jgi:hypothetical protein